MLSLKLGGCQAGRLFSGGFPGVAFDVTGRLLSTTLRSTLQVSTVPGWPHLDRTVECDHKAACS